VADRVQYLESDMSTVYLVKVKFLTRWLSRPSTEPGSWAPAKWLFWIAAFAFLPTWLVEQPNPDWRGLTWLLAFEVVILNLCAVYFVGGRPWLRHFAFSLCFILTTLPWPGSLETFVIQGLMQVVAWVTVGLLNLSHIAALQHGNLIEVKAASWESTKPVVAFDRSEPA
jgi:hypothetical protein